MKAGAEASGIRRYFGNITTAGKTIEKPLYTRITRLFIKSFVV